MNDEARKKLEKLANEDPEKFKQAIFGLNIERDVSVHGWCVEMIWSNNDYARVLVTDRKLEDMGIESTREDVALHIEDLMALLNCSDVE